MADCHLGKPETPQEASRIGLKTQLLDVIANGHPSFIDETVKSTLWHAWSTLNVVSDDSRVIRPAGRRVKTVFFL